MKAYELAATALVSALGAAFGGQQRLNVVIFDLADTRGDTITEAAGMARRFFHEAGVDTEWTVCHMAKHHNACALPPAETYLKLSVLAEADRNTRKTMGTALITKTGEAVVSYAFFDRATTLAKSTGQPVRVVLACIIAHEIGHLMGLKHNAGIMKADLAQREIFDAAQERLQFTAEDAGLLREFAGNSLNSSLAAHR